MEKCQDKIERIIDANLNRAKEGLRVVEDIARFVIDNKKISKNLKNMRSEIAAIQKTFKDTILYRDTESDVGTSIDSKQEQLRESLIDIIEANSKRTQESLRVLEEMFKLKDLSVSKQFKRLRYESYTIEKETIKNLKKVTQ